MDLFSLPRESECAAAMCGFVDAPGRARANGLVSTFVTHPILSRGFHHVLLLAQST